VSDGQTRLNDVRWRALLKIMAAGALVWLWLQLYQTVLLVVVAALMAVTINPAVTYLERHRWPRWLAAVAISGLLLLTMGAFGWLTWASLTNQAALLASRFSETSQQLEGRMPQWLQGVLVPDADRISSATRGYAVRLAQSTVSAITIGFLGFILMIYFLIEGRRTCDWLLAFVPERHRPRAEQTLQESERVIVAYAVGNGITSLFATAFTWVVLWWLHVPAALLLAIMAGLSDFIPVIGFVVSSVPAVLLAVTVSPTTVLLVVLAYVAYNTVESYLLSPWAYGNRLNLSNVAVILAFVVGAELAGVIGALIALPLAALYPTIERLWLRRQLGEDTVREHEALEHATE